MTGESIAGAVGTVHDLTFGGTRNMEGAMIDLVLSVCMASSPGTCKEEHLYYESRGTLAQCMMLSSPYVAEWAGNHPDWTVKSWACHWPEDRKQGI